MVRNWIASSLMVVFAAVPALAAETGGPVVEETSPSIVLNTTAAPQPVAFRGPILPVLYGTLTGLQAFDGWSTLHATTRGASETNPLMSGLVGSSGAVWAVKAGTTMASIYVAENLWRRGHRAQAIVIMVAANGVMAVVASRNASVIGGLK